MGNSGSCEACAGNGQLQDDTVIGGVRKTAKLQAPMLSPAPDTRGDTHPREDDIVEVETVEIADDKALEEALNAPRTTPQRVSQDTQCKGHRPHSTDKTNANAIHSDEKPPMPRLGRRLSSMPELLGKYAGASRRGSLPSPSGVTKPIADLSSKRARKKWARSQSVELKDILKNGDHLDALVEKIDCSALPSDRNPLPVLKFLASAINKMNDSEPGRWAISKLVGIESDSSIVVAATDETLGEVGIKIMGTASAKAFSASVKAKLVNSAKAMKRVRHQNCCQTLDWSFSADSTMFWLVREYFSGDIFSAIIKRKVVAEHAAIQAGIQILQVRAPLQVWIDCGPHRPICRRCRYCCRD
jgi:hypothetical protein